MTMIGDEGGNGTGRTSLDKAKDDEIARLRAEVEVLRIRDSDVDVGRSFRSWKKILTGALLLIGVATALFGVLAWYTATQVNAAILVERDRAIETAKTVVQERLTASRFASIETVAVQQQQLSDIRDRLYRIENKLDLALTKRQR
jgi:hypothetical protein